MSPYTSLLVLALAASIVTPVLSADPAQRPQPQGGSQGVWSRLKDLNPAEKTVLAALGLLAAGTTGLAVWGSIGTNKPNTTNSTID